MPNLAVQVNYSYTQTTDLFGNFTGTITPRVGVTLADYTPGSGFTGTLPDGTPYSVPTFIPNAGRDRRRRQRLPDRRTSPATRPTTTGIEIGAEQAAVEPWMGRVGFSLNNAREHFDDDGRHLRHQRQPDADRDRAAEERRPVRAAERRQRLGHDLHQREMAVQRQRDVSGAVGPRAERQRVRPPGLSVPDRSGRARPRRSAPTRRSRCWSTPAIDTFRYPNLWNTDLRVARAVQVPTA